MLKLRRVLYGVILLALLGVWYFNISLTALPTTFAETVEGNTPDGLTVGQVERIDLLWLRSSMDEDFNVSGPDNVHFTLEDREQIDRMLQSDLRIYEGGRIDGRASEFFFLYVYFEDGSRQQYQIWEDRIESSNPDHRKVYKVLDEENEIYDALLALVGG